MWRKYRELVKSIEKRRESRGKLGWGKNKRGKREVRIRKMGLLGYVG